jgi:hypothetical protein
MSKNKNPLKDLDLFLKQQASSFVSPTPLSEKIQEETKASPDPSSTISSSNEDMLQAIDKLMDQNPDEFYDLLIRVAEQKPSAERTVLINTALYLKNSENWKEAIREYWKNSKIKI